MTSRIRCVGIRNLRLPLFALAALAAASSVPAQDGPPPAVRNAVRAVVRMLEAGDEATLASFAEEHLAPAYRASFAAGALLDHLRALRASTQGATATETVPATSTIAAGAFLPLPRLDDGSLITGHFT